MPTKNLKVRKWRRLTSPFNDAVYLACAEDWKIWRIGAYYHKLNQVLIVILAALPDVVSLLNQINIVPVVEMVLIAW